MNRSVSRLLSAVLTAALAYPASAAEWAFTTEPAAGAAANATRIAAGSSPSEVGQWLPPMSWDVIAIHAAMMPTGKVLHYAYPGNDGSRARLWNPATGDFTNVDMNTDIFCSGLSFQPDGSLLVTGGNDYNCDFQGRFVTNLFDPFSEMWSFAGNMLIARWYPTNILLGDGRTLITSGLNTHCEVTNIMEVYTPEDGLFVIPEGARLMDLFPRLHLLTSGKIAHVGIESETSTFDPDAGVWEFVDDSNVGWRCQGSSVLLPGRTDQVMIMGGMCPLTATCEIIDFSSPQPEWRMTGSLHHQRGHADALILPDQSVMVVGGGTMDLYGGPVLIPELFDPQTETWQELPAHVHSRMYHATTILLPDARVLSAGQDDGDSAYFGEIYEPAYLFRGSRPEIAAVPARLAYGGSFSLHSPQASDIQSVALIMPSAVTHSVNFTQRYVGLDFSILDANTLSISAPPNGNHAPPGYYMLFILNNQGVPSVAPFVNVGSWVPGDLDGNRTVDVNDLVALIGAWGPCAGCAADLDGDGVVRVADLLVLILNWG